MEDQLFCAAPAGQGCDLVLKLFLRIQIMVSFIIDLHRIAEGTGGSRNNGDLMYRRRVFLERRNECMAYLVVGYDKLFLVRHDLVLLLVAGNDNLDSLLEIRLDHALTSCADGAEGSFIDDICKLCTGSARRCFRNCLEVNIGRHLDVLCMYLQDVDSTLEIRELHRNSPVETARTKKCRIKLIRLVRRSEDDDSL